MLTQVRNKSRHAKWRASGDEVGESRNMKNLLKRKILRMSRHDEWSEELGSWKINEWVKRARRKTRARALERECVKKWRTGDAVRYLAASSKLLMVLTKQTTFYAWRLKWFAALKEFSSWTSYDIPQRDDGKGIQILDPWDFETCSSRHRHLYVVSSNICWWKSETQK
jgi:hypothetical protein